MYAWWTQQGEGARFLWMQHASTKPMQSYSNATLCIIEIIVRLLCNVLWLHARWFSALSHFRNFQREFRFVSRMRDITPAIALIVSWTCNMQSAMLSWIPICLCLCCISFPHIPIVTLQFSLNVRHWHFDPAIGPITSRAQLSYL